MVRTLCNACTENIFRGEKNCQTRGNMVTNMARHLNSAEKLLDGAGVGCIFCVQIIQYLEMGPGVPQSPARFETRRVFYEYTYPEIIQFFVEWQGVEENEPSEREYRGPTFAMVPITPMRGMSLKQMYPEIASRSDSDETMQLMKRWYRNCLHDHGLCSRRTIGGDEVEDGLQLPTRLIDIGSAGSKEFRVVMETDATGPGKISHGYATLSHRWGSATFL
ncbi:unnamed protein product [Clonostachys rhizophaga]|uniref:Uncharacterized protein n=1 Tax=Clonostachys rhizophaga TaxID=160324 RepID=A0A9N9VJZ5_9HYPO|nr:unnamed protein product [Clonostachys rhizophaga]